MTMCFSFISSTTSQLQDKNTKQKKKEWEANHSSKQLYIEKRTKTHKKSKKRMLWKRDGKWIVNRYLKRKEEKERNRKRRTRKER